jgi:hypothetical protein
VRREGGRSSDVAARPDRGDQGLWLGAVVVGVLLSLGLGVLALVEPGSAAPRGLAPNAVAPGTAEVTYEIESSGFGSVTYGVGGLSAEQRTSAVFPFRMQVALPDEGDHFVVAQRLSAGSDDEIRCRITRDGAVVAESTARGEFGAVTCRR